MTCANMKAQDIRITPLFSSFKNIVPSPRYRDLKIADFRVYSVLAGTRGLRPHHPWCYPILSILGCGRGQNFFKTISECSTGLYLSIATSHDIIQQIWKNAIFSILGCDQTHGRGWKFLKSISERSPGLYLSIDTPRNIMQQ